MVLDTGVVFMDHVKGDNSEGSSDLLDLNNSKTAKTSSNTKTMLRPQAGRSNVSKQKKAPPNGFLAQKDTDHVVESKLVSQTCATARPPLRHPLSLDMTSQCLQRSQEQMADRRLMQPPWRSGSAAPSPPARSLTSLSLGAGGWMRRSESTCSVNQSLGLRAKKGTLRPATSLPHIAKAVRSSTLSPSTRPCLLIALRPLNLEQEKQKFFQCDYKYEPQFEYAQPEPKSVLDKYSEGSGLFLEQAVGIMECVLKKFGSYENFEEVTGGTVLPKSQVWATVRKYLQKEGCVGEVVVRLSDELLSQAVMMVESCRPTLTINLAGARQHWLEGMLRHEIGTHYLRGVNNSFQPWATAEGRKQFGLKPANPTEEGLASLHSVLLRKQPYLWRAALLYYTVFHAGSMSFSQLFSHVARFVQHPDVRWEYCLRAKRGQTDTSQPGCFSKDQVYLDGILRILRHRRNIDFKMLTSLGKVCVTFIHPTGEQANWEQVSATIGYKMSFPELLSHSQAKMGRGSPLCEQVREKIIENFKDNVPQCRIARNLGISSSTLHIIIKRFRESGEITVCKRHGRKPTLNTRDLRSLRRHCIKNRHQCVKDITTWAQEHIRKPMSVNTVWRYIGKCNLKLYYAKQKPFLNNTQKCRRLLWARAHLRWTDAKWKGVLWSDESTLQIVFGNCGRRVL